jgi:uncharacterized membrane protein YeaQ/YmgE (transglycosylase-associated protein family)
MGLLAWIVAGAIVGWLVGYLVKGRAGFRRIGDIVLGVVGGVVGGVLAAQLLNLQDVINSINLTSLLAAFVGAVVAIVVIRLSGDSVKASNVRL